MRPALAAAATLVAVAFACSTFERWITRADRRTRRHELAWSFSLVLFAVASGALWWGASAGWTEVSFRVFFLFGAILNVPFLALGTVYLLAGRRVGDVTALALGLLGGFAVGVLTVAPLHGSLGETQLPKGSEVFGVLPRVLAAVASGLGALVVIGGALWSLRRLRGRREAGPRPVVANVLIALGTLILGASGTLNARFGAMNAFSVTLVVGISVLFAGFLVATSAGSTPSEPDARPWMAATRHR